MKTVLVVEDNTELNRLYCKALTRSYVHVQGLESVHQAKSYLKTQNPPNVIILDLEFHDGHGSELLSLLESPRFAQTEVIVVSGRAYQAGNNEILNRANYVLLKPISPRGLATLIEAL